MSENSPPSDNLIHLPEGEPIVLVGDPKSLRGELHLRNLSEKRIVVRGVAVHGLSQAQGEATGLAANASMAATLAPGQESQARLTVSLNNNTRPGEYHGELEVAGHTRPIVLHITEVVQLDIAPKTVVIDDCSGATVVKRVVFSNNGNVPLTISEIGSVALGEELLLRRSFDLTVAADGKQTDQLSQFFAEVIGDEAKPIVGLIGYMEIRNLTGTVELQPGEVRTLDLQFHLPEKLKKNSRYIGRVPFYTSDLEFVVVPVSGGQKLSATPSDKPQAQKSD